MVDTAREERELTNLLKANGNILAEALVHQIKDGEPFAYIPSSDQKFTSESTIKALRTWASTHYPTVFSPEYLKQISDPVFIQEFIQIFTALPKTKQELDALKEASKKAQAEFTAPSRPGVEQLKEWQKALKNHQKDLAEYDHELSLINEANPNSLYTLNNLDLNAQISLLQAYRANLAKTTPPKVLAESKIDPRTTQQAFRKAVQDTTGQLKQQHYQAFQKQVLETTRKQFAQAVLDLGIADKQLEAQIGQKVADKHANACAEKASELYSQYLKEGWTEATASKAAAKEALRITTEPLYAAAYLTPNGKVQQRMEDQLAATLRNNSQTVIQTNKNLTAIIEPLQMTTSPDYEEMVALFEENLGQGLLALGQTPDQVERLKPHLHQEALRKINRLSEPFADEKLPAADTAVFQSQLEAEIRGSLTQFTSARQRRNQAEIQAQAEALSQNLGQTTYDYCRFQPSLSSRFQAIGGLSTFEALLTDPKLIPGFATSLLFRDSKFQRFRLTRLAEKTGLDIFTLKAGLVYSPQAVGNLIAGLQSGESLFGLLQVKEGILPTDPRILKLNQLALNLGKVEDIIKNPHGLNQRLFSLQARLNQARYKLFETAGKINPLRPMFYAYDFLKEETLTNIHRFTKPIAGFKEHLKGTRFGWFIAPAYKAKVGWSNFLKNHSRLNRFVKFLPKLKPSYWVKAGIKGAGRWVAKKAGSWLLAHASKGLFKLLGTKLLGWGAAAVAGAATGGVATALVAIGTVLHTAASIIFSKEGREVIKKVGMIAAAAVGAIIQFVVHLLASLKFTLLGALLGGIIGGPVGAFFGGALGYVIDKGGVSFLQNAGASLVGAGSAGIGGAAATATAGIAGAAAPATGLAALSPAMAVPASIGLIGLLSYSYFVNVNSSFVLPANLGPGPEIAEYSQDGNLSVDKNADPTILTGATTTITYTIEVSSQNGGLTNVIITDDFDENYLEIQSISHSPTSRNGTITWDIDQMVQDGVLSQDFSQAGAKLIITYEATTKSGVNTNTRIRNEVEVTAQKQGETLTRKDYVVINSACNDVVTTAQTVMGDLVKGNSSECIAENLKCNQDATSRGYQTLFNCPVSDEWKDETGHGCIYCNNLVTIAYVKNGRPNPIGAFAATAAKWEQEGILTVKNGKGDINDVSEGDVIFFDVGSTPFRHTGLVCDVNPTEGRVCACEANNWTTDLGKLCYSWSNGSFIPLGTRIKVAINAIGDTCQE